MSKDPFSKSGKLASREPIPKSRGRRGKIYTDRDYSSSFTSTRSRIIYLACCLLPYIAICTMVYLEGLEVLALLLLSIPLVLFLVFWFLDKKLS